jgi:ribosome-binding protein aMBF1 (putative translation factor)
MASLIKLDSALRSVGNTNRWRRLFSTRLDMTLKRAQLSSSRVARALKVPESLVRLWRAGVATPTGDQCTRLSSFLKIDVQWLCDLRKP